jgi:peptidoglycan/LPS O-acetylase OafA/YrhL
MKPQRGPAELPNLDILRSVAVLLVVLAHTLMYTHRGAWDGWMGLTGVSMFFVHTCLVLMWSLERDPHVGRFYLRRVFRIYPLWLVVLALTILVKLPISPAYAPAFRFYEARPMEILHNVLLTFNLFCLGPNKADTGGGAHIVGASWSLAVEVQMYLFLPVLFFFARSMRQLWPLIAIDGFVILYDRILLSATDTNLLGCVPYFLPGIIAYVLTKKQRPMVPAWVFPLFLLVYVAVHRSIGTVRATRFFCLLLGLMLPMFHQVSWRPVVRVSHLIARYSYGIYLCHMGAIAIGDYYLRDHSHGVRAAGYLGFLIAAAVVLYHTIEKPMIRLGSKLASHVETGKEPTMNEENLSLEPAP